MISLPRKALPRRRPNRVRLVEPNGSPARPSAESWPAWTDNHYWEPGESPAGLSDHITLCVPEPDETDAEWLARLEEQEEAETARVLARYQPCAEDLREYEVWSQALDSGTLPPAEADHFTLGESAMSFPAHEYSKADRKRWQHQNNLSEQSFNTPAD